MERRPPRLRMLSSSLYRVRSGMCVEGPMISVHASRHGARQMWEGLHLAPPHEHLVEPNHCHDRCVRHFEEPDAPAPKRLVATEHQPPGSKDEEREEVKRRVEVGEAVTRRGLENIDAVDVDVLVVRLV